MIVVEIIQFILPSGKQRHESLVVSDDCQTGYKLLQECGCRLTYEILRTGEISCAIEEPCIGDFDLFLSPVGPTAQVKLEQMIKNFTAERFNTWTNIHEKSNP